jgi:hypothetical protein
MQIKFPNLNAIRNEFKAQKAQKTRPSEISEIASKCLKEVHKSGNFTKILKGIVENLRV